MVAFSPNASLMSCWASREHTTVAIFDGVRPAGKGRLVAAIAAADP
jgi:hypothetical protein